MSTSLRLRRRIDVGARVCRARLFVSKPATRSESGFGENPKIESVLQFLVEGRFWVIRIMLIARVR